MKKIVLLMMTLFISTFVLNIDSAYARGHHKDGASMESPCPCPDCPKIMEKGTKQEHCKKCEEAKKSMHEEKKGKCHKKMSGDKPCKKCAEGKRYLQQKKFKYNE